MRLQPRGFTAQSTTVVLIVLPRTWREVLDQYLGKLGFDSYLTPRECRFPYLLCCNTPVPLYSMYNERFAPKTSIRQIKHTHRQPNHKSLGQRPKFCASISTLWGRTSNIDIVRRIVRYIRCITTRHTDPCRGGPYGTRVRVWTH